MITKKNKLGISLMIGYILLISFGLVISPLVYQVLKTYIPKQSLNCDEGVSISLNGLYCYSPHPGNYTLNMNIKNNGRFNISGYFIHAKKNSSQKLATLDISNFLNSGSPNQTNISNSIVFSPNPLAPTKSLLAVFNNLQKIYSVTVIPFRYQKYKVRNNKETFVVCENAKITSKVNCR